MKVILQDYEPRQRPFGDTETKPQPVARKSRLRLNPIGTNLRLFHAL